MAPMFVPHFDSQRGNKVIDKVGNIVGDKVGDQIGDKAGDIVGDKWKTK